MRDWRHGDSVFLWAFYLIELNGDDLHCDPLAVRKATLASLLARSPPGLRLNEHLDHDDGRLVFEHACRSGLRASSLSGATRPIVRGARPTGSRARIRTHPP
jgi:ATP-dependent DNA ligase